MGGNALTETLVFGARAGEAAANWAMDGDRELKTEISRKSKRSWLNTIFFFLLMKFSRHSVTPAKNSALNIMMWFRI
jgi:succinate dehydrogenase/fumarate reductase flavoprotein subunit